MTGLHGRFTASNPNFQAEARDSYARQPLMATLGARLGRVEAGEVEIDLPVAPHILQQHGFVHAGALTSVVDTACGFAAFTLMPAGRGVLTAEFKMNLMSPAVGDRMIAIGRVVKPGRTLMVTLGEVYAESAGARKLVALMTATMAVVDQTGVKG